MTTQALAASRSPTTALRWLPAVVAATYVAIVFAKFSGLVHSLFWDSDVASLNVLAERLRGHGDVWIPHYGSWTPLWSLLATRSLPGHVALWEAAGYAFALLGAVLVGWATAQVAGRWAGMTAGAVALSVGPFAARSELTLGYHRLPGFTAAVLAAYVATLGRTKSWLVPVLVGLFAGVNAASDPLTWVAAIVPFAVAAAVFVARTRRRDIAARTGTTVALAIAAALATNAVMNGLGFRVVGLEIGAAHLGDLPGNVRQLGRMIALLGGANYALPGGYPREPIRIVVALLALAGVAAAVVAAVKAIVRRVDATILAYAAFWGAAAMLLGISFVTTTNASSLGAGSMNYLLPLALAAGAGTALLAAGSTRAELGVAAAVACVGIVNIAGIANGKAGTSDGALGRHEREVVDLLVRKGVTRGYAGYWDASNLTWKSGRRVLVAPITRCDRHNEPRLCAYRFFSIRSWYDERPGPSFLIVDPTTAFVTQPPPVVRTATESHRFGPITVYLFPYDLARHIHQPPGNEVARRREDLG